MNRTRWLLGAVLTAVALLTAAVLVAIPPAFIAAGNGDLEGGRLLRAEDRFTAAEAVPAAEPWIAPFNRGVARYHQEKWDVAAQDFERAALNAPLHMQCPVSLNWAAALESGADALKLADDLKGAGLRYQQALMVLSMAVCPDDEPGMSEGSQAQDWNAARERLTGKVSGAPAPGEPAEAEEQPDVDQELEDRAAQAQQERQNAEVGADPRSGGGDSERTW